MSRQVVVLGGGIAGLSAAWHLARQSGLRVTLFEREPLLCTHASGRNAAIFRPLEADEVIAELALRSRRVLDELGAERPLIDQRGLVLLGRTAERLAAIRDTAELVGTDHRYGSPPEVARWLGELHPTGAWHGVHAGDAGVIDIHAMTEALARACRALGVRIHTGVEVRRLVPVSSRVASIEVRALPMGVCQSVECDDVVLACGAWSAPLAASAGLSLPLMPVRRHLVLLRPQRKIAGRLPVVWSLDDEVYFRQEGDGLLASPCDETQWPSGPPQADVGYLEPLAGKLAAIDRSLGRARVVRHWACLRTFAPDRRPVVGADPRLAGVHWLTGLGGFGMTVGAATGERLAQQLVGRSPLDATLSPARLLARAGLSAVQQV